MYIVNDMDDKINFITEKIIGCAITIHKSLGPGLLESIYEKAMCIELKENNLNYESQKQIPVYYKNTNLGLFKIDLVVENQIILELKSTERMDPVYDAQILSYMKLGNFKFGMLINFNSSLLKYGIKRFIL